MGGNVFFGEKSVSAHPLQGSREKPAEGVSSGKRQSSGMRELLTKAKAQDMALARPPMGGNVFMRGNLWAGRLAGLFLCKNPPG